MATRSSHLPMVAQDAMGEVGAASAGRHRSATHRVARRALAASQSADATQSADASQNAGASAGAAPGDAAPVSAALESSAAAAWRHHWPRVALFAGLVAGVLAAPLLARGQPAAVEDPELAVLLRFMGYVKLLLAAVVSAGVWWRAGKPFASPVVAVAYAGASAVLVMAAVLIVLLSQVGQAAAVYHGAAFILLVLLLQDRELPKSLHR